MVAMLPSGLAGPVEVALARAVERVPHPGALPGGCRYEPKWDGIRVIATHAGGAARLWSRRGTDLSATFPEIVTAVQAQVREGTVLDGELVMWADGRLAFRRLLSRMGRGPRAAVALARTQPASYAVFDVLAVDGRDVRSRPFDDRRAVLERLAEAWRPPLNLSPVTDDVQTARRWFEEYAVAGLEGLVVKGGGEAYPVASRRVWLKVKRREVVDVVCGAVIGTRSAPRQVVAGLPVEGRLRVVGRTGPLPPAARDALAQWLAEPAGEHPWPRRLRGSALGRFNAGAGEIDLTLVEPVTVEVSADGAWDGSSFRHLLRLVRPRPDIAAADVRPPPRPGQGN